MCNKIQLSYRAKMEGLLKSSHICFKELAGINCSISLPHWPIVWRQWLILIREAKIPATQSDVWSCILHIVVWKVCSFFFLAIVGSDFQHDFKFLDFDPRYQTLFVLVVHYYPVYFNCEFDQVLVVCVIIKSQT